MSESPIDNIKQFEIPSGQYSSPEFLDVQPIREEINAAYQDQEVINKQLTQNVVYLFESGQDQIVHPKSQKAYHIADNIKEARKYHLKSISLNAKEKSPAKILAAKLFKGALPRLRSETTERDLIVAESELGGEIFGQTPGRTVKFFNNGREHWYYVQQITDDNNKIRSEVFHYEFHNDCVTKSTSTEQVAWKRVDGEELANLMAAIEIYHQRVTAKYNYDHHSNHISDDYYLSDKKVA